MRNEGPASIGWLWGGLLLLTLVRLAVAAAMPLSPDEAYYWVWSRALAPGYLDHPPMVAVWAWCGTALLGDTALGVRLLAPLSAALGSVLLADAGRRLFGPGAGLRAAVLLNATLMLGAGAVTMTPDTPLLFFWTAAAWALARLAAPGAVQGGRWWLVAGAAAGLAFDSKYTAALLAPCAGLLLLLPAMRPWWRRPAPWLAAGVAVAMTAPVLWWNATHGWASLLKQGGRVGDWTPTLRFLAELLGGQVGLATPGVFALFCLGVGFAARRCRATGWSPGWALPVLLVAPGLLVFLQHAVGDRVQANWVAVLYPGCALAAAAHGRWWRPAAALGFALTALVYLQAGWAPLPLPRALDPTLRLAGWDALGTALAQTARQQDAAFVAAEDYGAAALLAWSGPELPVVAAEARWRLFDLPSLATGQPGLLLLSTRRREPPDPAFWQSAALVGELRRGRGGVEAEAYRLYRVVQRPGPGGIRLPEPRRLSIRTSDADQPR
ncbi:MAG: glycosyltransferase family 39 protein [Janthinobacterium lividum]